MNYGGFRFVKILIFLIPILIISGCSSESTDGDTQSIYQNVNTGILEDSRGEYLDSNGCYENECDSDDGYNRAEDNEIYDTSDCDSPTQSFYRGCEDYVKDLINAIEELSCEDLYGLHFVENWNGECECRNGYIYIDGSCVSGHLACNQLLGLFANFNPISNECECGVGAIYHDGKCERGDSICQSILGIYSTYDSMSEQCECRHGYEVHEGTCQNLNSVCRSIFGMHSRYSSVYHECECSYNYYVYNGECMSMDSICKEKFGRSYRYDILDDVCVG